MRNKRTLGITQPADHSAESELTISGRSSASYLDVVAEDLTYNSQFDGRFQTLTSLASMILVVTGPAILVCAACKSFETLGVILALYLAGVATGAAIFRFRAGEFESHILIALKTTPMTFRCRGLLDG